MKKTLSILLTTLSISSITFCEAAALTLNEIPAVEIDAEVRTALEAVRYAEAWRSSDKKEFFIEFAENNSTAAEEIFNLVKYVDSDTAAELYEVYVARPDSTKAMIMTTAKLMKRLGQEYRFRAKALKDVARSISE